MITCDGDKFVIARWIYDFILKDIRSYINSFGDEALVKSADIAILRNRSDFNKLGNKIMEELQNVCDSPSDATEYSQPIVWSWHIPDPGPEPIPRRMILFRGEEEMCTVWFEQVELL